MRDVGVREFRDHVSEYLSGGEPLAVRKHGRLLGFYLPAKQKSDAEELQAAVRDLGESLTELRRATGLSEEEIVEELVPKEHEDRGRERVGG
jgi:antitoxin (DNA-binding transcriptional repressor) of toxin-antitoxin stability system